MFKASRPLVCALSFIVCASLGSRAGAQPVDAVGVRAQGMGGAFTGVADDATASWWNPAGIAGGAYFNALLEFGKRREPPEDRTPAGDLRTAQRAETRSFAASYPALAVSYYRLRISEIQPITSTGAETGGRQEGGATEVRLRSLVLSQLGASVGHSLGSHLVIASTVKLLTAGVAAQRAPEASASLDAAADLDPSGDTHGGLDIGVMAVLGRARIGMMVRNVIEPEFGSGVEAFTLRRQVRLGGAVSSGSRGVVGGATVAVDGDVTTTPSIFGDERRVAVGGEVWTVARTFGIRGGVNVNTIGDRRTSLSGGLSGALKKGMYVDGQLTGGTDEGRRGWAVGLRVTF